MATKGVIIKRKFDQIGTAKRVELPVESEWWFVNAIEYRTNRRSVIAVPPGTVPWNFARFQSKEIIGTNGEGLIHAFNFQPTSSAQNGANSDYVMSVSSGVIVPSFDFVVPRSVWLFVDAEAASTHDLTVTLNIEPVIVSEREAIGFSIAPVIVL